jgi:hypothetical protein
MIAIALLLPGGWVCPREQYRLLPAKTGGSFEFGSKSVAVGGDEDGTEGDQFRQSPNGDKRGLRQNDVRPTAKGVDLAAGHYTVHVVLGIDAERRMPLALQPVHAGGPDDDLVLSMLFFEALAQSRPPCLVDRFGHHLENDDVIFDLLAIVRVETLRWRSAEGRYTAKALGQLSRECAALRGKIFVRRQKYLDKVHMPQTCPLTCRFLTALGD